MRQSVYLDGKGQMWEMRSRPDSNAILFFFSNAILKAYEMMWSSGKNISFSPDRLR